MPYNTLLCIFGLQVYSTYKDSRQWNGIKPPNLTPQSTRKTVCLQRQKNRISLGVDVSSVGFPSHSLVDLLAQTYMSISRPWLQRRAQSPPPKNKPQSKSSLHWEENCFVYRSEGESCVRISDVPPSPERELAQLCSQGLLVRKSLKCSRCGSQVRMMRNMLVLCFVCLICVCFFGQLTCLFKLLFVRRYFIFILIRCHLEPSLL